MPHAQLTDRRQLVSRLRSLAGQPELAPRAEDLQALADDLDRGGSGLEQWAELDLLRAFEVPEGTVPAAVPSGPLRAIRGLVSLVRGLPGMAPRAALRHLRDRLRERPVRDEAVEAVLGVLVFFPLLVTWFALLEASDAYGRLSAADPKEATRPFLQLWESGFDGRLASWARFGDVALLAVLLLVLLVLVAGWHARLRTRAAREEQEQRNRHAALAAELTSVLTRVQLLLVAHRAASPQRFTAELSKAAGRLEVLIRKSVTAQAALANAAASAEGAAVVLQEAAQRLAAEVPPLGGAAARIEQAVQAGTDSLRKVQDGAADAVRSVGDRIGRAGDLVETAVRNLTDVQGKLLASSQAAVDATGRAAQALVDSAGRTGDAVENMRQAAERWDAAAAHWEDAAARVDTGIRQLAGGPVGRVEAVDGVPAANGGVGKTQPVPLYDARPGGGPEDAPPAPRPGEHGERER